MILIEEPSITLDIEVWRHWLSELNNMSVQFRSSDAINSSKGRASRIIIILEKYPNGLTASSPDFKRVVKELSK